MNTIKGYRKQTFIVLFDCKTFITKLNEQITNSMTTT